LDNFFYNWTDFTFSPADWWWAGLSSQRLKPFQTDTELQHGILVGAGYEYWSINAYGYSLYTDDPFLVVTLSAAF
jgi:hypothetical protein